MARVVRPGGAVCIITELVLNGERHSEYFMPSEMQDMFLQHPTLRLEGTGPERRLALVEAVNAAAVPSLLGQAETPNVHVVSQIQTPVALKGANVAADARVFAQREDLVSSFATMRPSTVVEIGVALGDFSQFMIETFRPSRFVAFDVFTMHCFPVHWGRPSNEIFGGLTHREFYEKRMAGLGSGFELVVEVGQSADTLKNHPDGTFDLIYVDGAHDYEGVRMDAVHASRLASPDGLLIFNDYMLYDHIISAPYGVVQAVNELLAGGEWVVAGLALQQHMFCDIALRRVTSCMPRGIGQRP